MKTHIRLVIFGKIALFLLLLSATCQAESGDENDFYARQLAWENQTGRHSAITVYASILEAPDMPDAVLHDVTQFLDGKRVDEESMESWLSESYWSCFEKIRQGAKLKDIGQGNYNSKWIYLGPSLSLDDAARGFAAYAVLEVQKGYEERAWSDLQAGIRMGYALQNENASFTSYGLGLSCRGKAAWGIRRFLLEQRPTQQQAAQYAESLSAWRAQKIDYIHVYMPDIEYWLDDYEIKCNRLLLQDPKEIGEYEGDYITQIKKPTNTPRQVRADCQYLFKFYEEFSQLTPEKQLAQFRDYEKKAKDYVAARTWKELFIFMGNPSFRMWVNDDLAFAREHLTALVALIRSASSPGEIERILRNNPDPLTGKPYEYQKHGYRPFLLRSTMNLHDFYSDVKDHNANLEVIQFGVKSD